MNVCRTFPEWVLDLDPLLRLSRYHDGCSQYLEEHLVSWRERSHSFRIAIRRLTRAEDPRSSHPPRVAQVMSVFGWREHREYVMHRKRPPCVGLPRRLAANITQYRSDSRPSHRQSLVRPYACIYNLLPANELYILLCFLALLIVDGHSECTLGINTQSACL